MSNGADPVGEIISRLAEIQLTLVPPAEAPNAPVIYDELTVEPFSLPCWLNVPVEGIATGAQSGMRSSTETINMMLLCGRADEKYSSRAQRLWVPIVRDAFSRAVKLGGNAVQSARITRWDYAPVSLNYIDYIAVTFSLECQLSEPFTFAP